MRHDTLDMDPYFWVHNEKRHNMLIFSMVKFLLQLYIHTIMYIGLVTHYNHLLRRRKLDLTDQKLDITFHGHLRYEIYIID